jgi:hypothetical protein
VTPRQQTPLAVPNRWVRTLNGDLKVTILGESEHAQVLFYVFAFVLRGGLGICL